MTDKTPVVPVGAAPATAEHFRIASQKPAVKFLSRGVQPPSQVYVGVNDDLFVLFASSVPNEIITIAYRLLRFDGEIVLGQFTLNVAATFTTFSYSEGLAEGFLLSMSVRSERATTRGRTFVRVFLSDPALKVGFPSQMLFADYVTFAMAPAHPNGRVLAPTEGPGHVYEVPFANTGAGNEINIVVPANARWRLNTITSTLTTSAVVGARRANLDAFAPGSAVYFGGAGQTQGASAGFIYTWAAGVPPMFDGVTSVTQPLPDDFILPPNAVIHTATGGLNAGDAWTNTVALVEEWLDNV